MKKEFFITKLSFRIFIIGATQLVVQLPAEMIVCSGKREESFTLGTIVISLPFAGAEMRSFFAPAFMCFSASCLFVNIQVHSTTKSTFSFFQGSFSGSNSLLA